MVHQLYKDSYLIFWKPSYRVTYVAETRSDSARKKIGSFSSIK